MSVENIKENIVQLCKSSTSFTEIVESLKGADPVLVKDLLLELENEKRVKKFDGNWVPYSFRRNKNSLSVIADVSLKIKHEPRFSFKKKPHPLDYEWRNSNQTLNKLCDLIKTRNSEADKVLMLGMPGLFMASKLRNLPQEITLIDNNNSILAEIVGILGSREGILERNLFEYEPVKKSLANAVFIDPPWYTPHFLAFIWFAAQSLELNGYLAISLPQINTRPHLSEERERWFSYCRELGLELEFLHEDEMEYVMPFFEFNAFRAAGITDLLPLWRKGDLAIFKKVKHIVVDRPIVTKFDDGWNEVEVSGLRLKVKTTDVITEDVIKINHIVKGDILPSVSSRDKRREDANIWTSGNRIFKVSNPNLFYKIAQQYSNSEIVRNENFQVISEYLDYLVTIETQEYLHYLNWKNYELENRSFTRLL